MQGDFTVWQKLVGLAIGLLVIAVFMGVAIGTGELQNRAICERNGKTWKWQHRYTWADGCLVWIEGKWVKLGNAYDPNDRN